MMYTLPFIFLTVFAQLQLFFAEYFGKEPVVTPKWLAKARYDWEVSPQKAIDELGLPVTSIEEGLRKTITFLDRLHH